MIDIINAFIENTVQCWGCAVFDRLFQIVSMASATMYSILVKLAFVIFVALFIAFVFNAIFQNIKGDAKDPFYTKSVQKVLVNSIIVLSLMGAGIELPRFITRITAEPATLVALTYNQALIRQTQEEVDERITYESEIDIPEDGMFRPELRDLIIDLMKTTITQFQSYMKLGVAIMDSAFTWKALLGIGAFIKHAGLFILGMFLFYKFFQLFIRFCFYFVDIIVAMALFAFFFPISLMLMAFDGAEHLPEVIKNVGKHISKDQIKKLINAIAALASCVLTYTIIGMFIAKFFSDADVSNEALMESILSGDVFESDLNDSNLEAITLTSAIVMTYVLDFMYKQIPQISNMILDVFGVKPENQLSEKMADDAFTISKNVFNVVKTGVTTVINGGEDKKGEDKEKDKEKEKDS